MAAGHRRYVALVGAALCAALHGGCDSGAFTPEIHDGAASLRVYANVAATTVVGLSVEVSAADISPALVFNIPVVGGVATGTVQVPTGSNRVFTLRAFDAGGVETHRGTASASVVAGSNPTLEVTLSPLQGERQISATLASVIVVVQPAADSILVGDSIRLTASVIDSVGNPVPGAVVHWASLTPALASVDSRGMVKGIAAGQAQVVATYGFVGASASIKVKTALPAVASVTAVPSSHTFTRIDETMQITATAWDANGNVVSGVQVTYAALNPSIVSVDQMGRMTARAAGVTSVIVTAACCDVSAAVDARVELTNPAPWRANEPAGMATQMDTGFGDPNYSSFGAFTTQTQQGFADATAPHSPNKVGRFHIPGSLTDGHTGAAWVNLPANTVRVYTAAWVKWSNPGIVHPGNQKMWYYYHGTDSSDGGLVTGFFPGDASNAIKPNGQPQGGSPGVMEPAGNDPRLPVKGEWFLIETLAVMNTSSQSNGIYRIWLNGELLVNHSNVLYRSAATPWRECNLNWYFGGGPEAARAYDTYIYVDHAYVSTSTTRQ
jgi:hypothetical protein